MNSYHLGLYEKAMPGNLSWANKFNCAKLAGFDFLEISIDETDQKLARLDWTIAERKQLVDTMFQSGMFIRTMCLSGHRKYPLGSADAVKRQRSMEIFQRAVQLACDLGIRIIQLAGYDVYYEDSTEQTQKYFLENLFSCAEYAAMHGVLLGFETMETPFMDTVQKAMHYVTAVNSPYLGVYADIGNLTNAALLYQRPVIQDMDAGKGHIIAIHIKETKPGHYREIPFGTGHVDFKTVIAKSIYLGVRTYVAECWHTGSVNWQGELLNTNHFIQNIIIESIK